MQIAANTTTSTSGSASASLASGTTTAAEQQDRFMKLLVAQMKNQDPLKPLDNAEMTSQIAQINTVAGIEKLNASVETLSGGFAGLLTQGATQLIGHDVLVEGNQLALRDGAARGGFELSGSASATKVEIVDGAGQVVRTLNAGASPEGVRQFTWDGRGADGTLLPDGDYKFKVTAVNGAATVDAIALGVADVQAVTWSGAGIQLDLGARGVVAYGDVFSFL